MIDQREKGSAMYLTLCCLVATIGGLLFGYDTGVISGAIEPLTAHFQLSDFMKGWASACVLVGCATGVLATQIILSNWFSAWVSKSRGMTTSAYGHFSFRQI